jgi:site-specific DNA-methyltransferase (adenine-specific)
MILHASMEDQTVVDPFMGSGTTGVACIQMNRRFVGIELDPIYFRYAVHRIKKQLLNKPMVFVPRPAAEPIPPLIPPAAKGKK